jgi:hypothetical protein
LLAWPWGLVMAIEHALSWHVIEQPLGRLRA